MTAPPDLSNTTSVPDDSTPDPADNSTALPTPDATLPADNSTTVDNSTTTDDATAATDNSTTAGTKRSFDGLTEWQSLCLISGGHATDIGEDDDDDDFGCINWAGFDATSALYADADPCEQQDNADLMITFAKSFGGDHIDDFISQAIAYRRYPRRVVKILGSFPSTPYCLTEPLNTELYGIYNEQIEGVEYGLYGGPSYPLISFGSGEFSPSESPNNI